MYTSRHKNRASRDGLLPWPRPLACSGRPVDLMVSKASADSFVAIALAPLTLPARKVLRGCNGSLLPAATPMRRMMPYTSARSPAARTAAGAGPPSRASSANTQNPAITASADHNSMRWKLGSTVAGSRWQRPETARRRGTSRCPSRGRPWQERSGRGSHDEQGYAHSQAGGVERSGSADDLACLADD